MAQIMRRRGWIREVVLIGIALAAGFVAKAAFGADADRPERKVVRQIGIMEKIMDQMLLDSPNLLIFGRDVTRGLYIEGFGAVFTFDASLVEKDKDSHWNFNFPFRVEDVDGKKVIIIDEDDKEDAKEAAKLLEEREARRTNVEEELYRAGKAEIISLMLDYGETMTSLTDAEHLAVAAYLKDANYFTKNKISRLVLKAKMADLRAHAAGKLSEEEMVRRMKVEEY
ncbi:MAG: hypothetical protein R3B81_02690 [bacterium]